MKHISIGIILLLGFLIMTSGCTFLGLQDEPPQETGFGNLIVSSNPWGGHVYIDGVYEGRAPLTVENVPVGTHELIITLDDYNDYTAAITITKDQSTSVKATLTKSQPKITLSISSANMGTRYPTCYWEIKGTVTNEGTAIAREMTLEGTIDPKDDKYSDTKKLISISLLNPGESYDYYLYIDGAPCVDSTGKVKCEYTNADDERKSVSKSI